MAIVAAMAAAFAFAAGQPSSAQTPVAADSSEILPIDAASFSSVLEEARGSVVLINLWATWCAPCLKEVPELLKLEAALTDRGFKLIGISLDDVDARDQVRRFRDEYFPSFATYHVTESDWFGLINTIEPNWSSVLPTSLVVNRDGTLVATLTGGKDYEAFAAAVEPHL